MADDHMDWPIHVGGGTSSSADLRCGRCSDHTFLDSAGDWPGKDDPYCTLAELIQRVAEHAQVCKGQRDA